MRLYNTNKKLFYCVYPQLCMIFFIVFNFQVIRMTKCFHVVYVFFKQLYSFENECWQYSNLFISKQCVYKKKDNFIYLSFWCCIESNFNLWFSKQTSFLFIFVVLYQKSIQCFFKECLLSQKSDVLLCFFIIISVSQSLFYAAKKRVERGVNLFQKRDISNLIFGFCAKKNPLTFFSHQQNAL